MATVAKRHQSQLERIKTSIETSYQYFRDNCDRFNQYRKMVCDTTMSPDDIAALKDQGKPQIEFNILEAHISRLRGEFSEQEPSVEVSSADGQEADELTIAIVEYHMRALLDDALTDNIEYDVFTDLLTGGFSALEIATEYANERSFNQDIVIQRVFDPTLVGFDPMARTSHKGDGSYCFQLYPVSKDDFTDLYGTDAARGIRFTRNIGGFSWSFQNDMNTEVIMCGRYFEKKKKMDTIVQLTTGDVMTMEDYEKFEQWWEQSGQIRQMPAVIGKPRRAETIIINQYKMCENKILEHVQTDYKYLPIVFVDGNSVFLKNSLGGATYQKTRPYIYNAKGAQQLKNYAGQCLANFLENMVQHKFIVAKEAIPEDYVDAYENIQKANTLVFNAFKDNNPQSPLPPPREIQTTPAPPEVTGTFGMMDEATQAILGSYDSSMGKTMDPMSGVAITRSITQSNMASKPYLVGFMKGLNRVAQIVLDLIPKYYTTPRTIPLKRGDGKRAYIPINQPQGFKVSYKENALKVKVSAGVNFEIQKDQALAKMTSLAQAYPAFADFMSRKGLPVLLDNIDIRGVDQLKKLADEYMKELDEQAKMAQQAQAQASAQNPVIIEAQIANKQMSIEEEKNRSDAMLKASSLSIDKQKADTDRMLAEAKIGLDHDKVQIEHDRMQSEETRDAVDLAIKHSEQLSRHQAQQQEGVRSEQR